MGMANVYEVEGYIFELTCQGTLCGADIYTGKGAFQAGEISSLCKVPGADVFRGGGVEN